MADGNTPGKLALVVGGGPAPGINGVISSVTIEAINHGYEVIGFRDGYKWPVQGDSDHVRTLTIADVSRINLSGGSILGTSRTNPAKNPDDMKRVLDVFARLGITALVSIGGDDTAFSASQVYKHLKGKVKVAHVPKTIDNDLPLPPGVPTFGFETARHHGVFITRSLAEDAKTTARWYLVVSMGRAAGHLALGIGKAAAATLTIIPEEFRNRHVNLNELVDLVIGSIVKRKALGKLYGVAVLAEGLIEAIPESDLVEAMGGEGGSRYGTLERDPHGHMRLGEIEFGRMVKDRIQERLKELGVKLTLIDKDLGYELRCADPIPFDAEYTRDLGYGAVKFLRSPESAKYGAVISIVGGRMQPLPFDTLLNPTTKRMLPRRVDVDSETYECARRYMIRLERKDFEDAEQLGKLAASVGLEPEAFRERFSHVADLA